MTTRLTIAGLMTLVGLAAVLAVLAVAALALRPGMVTALTAALLAAATLGVPLARGRLRPFCLGFAVAGWAYFLAACTSPWIRLNLPTNVPLIHLYESTVGPPTLTGPEDVVPFILWLHDYLRVAHALVALLAGVTGGVVALLVAATPRVRGVLAGDRGGRS